MQDFHHQQFLGLQTCGGFRGEGLKSRGGLWFRSLGFGVQGVGVWDVNFRFEAECYKP